MSEQDPGKQRFVTNAELRDELNKIPTRWEVYTLILGAVFMNQVLPGISIAKAGLSAASAVIP